MDPARALLLRQLPQVDEMLRHPQLSCRGGPLAPPAGRGRGAPHPGGPKGVAHHRSRRRPARRIGFEGLLQEL